jgi:hypothetical protein
MNSFFTVDATRITDTPVQDGRLKTGRIVSDVLSCGQGIYGSLGNGRWVHTQGEPTKIKSLSGLFEWDEATNSVVPIRVARLSVGATHSAVVLDNVTFVNAKKNTSQNDTNWGADVLWWGGNEFFQLGTGKRNNQATPGYIAPLDTELSALREKPDEQHRFHLTPKKTIQVGGSSVSVEQRVECGRGLSAIYSAVAS